MIYNDYKRNHVIFPGREEALKNFLEQRYDGIGPHKWKNGFNSHSEDALTWSCFDLLSNFPMPKKISVLDEIFEDAYQGKSKLLFKNGCFQEDEIQIHIGKQYTGLTSKEKTEVDASIELPGKLIFFEAKLYSTGSMASPPDKRFEDKWKSAWLFKYYKSGRNNSLRPLKEALINIPSAQSFESIAENMGWLTWSDLFKTILR